MNSNKHDNIKELSGKQIQALLSKMSILELEDLCEYLRNELIANVAKTGGHLASNLGMVELTVAMIRSFDFENDKIIFDVGHQAYIYKMLTGRLANMNTMRQKDGLCGFPRRAESSYDCFDTGHSSTSLSAALGMAISRDLTGGSYEVIAVIGDGAMTGGMAFEALNHIGSKKSKIKIILNDNQMSISPNVGAVKAHLSRLRGGKGYINLKKWMKCKMPMLVKPLEAMKNGIKYIFFSSSLFEELGIKYLGPVEGHDFDKLEKILGMSKNFDVPVVIHVLTQKGRGYLNAENNPEVYHGVAPFDIEKGVERIASKNNSAIFSDSLVALAEKNKSITAITAAMPMGTGLQRFYEKFPERFFDVGIAEQHAITMAAGMAAAGIRPFVAIYSSFLQRAYDSLIHDVCLQNMPVVIGVDRCGIVGEDGATHHGLYDIAYLRNMPNMVLMSPSSIEELSCMVEIALGLNKPCAIRYGRGILPSRELYEFEGLNWEYINPSSIMIAATGAMVKNALEACEILKGVGIEAGVANMRFLSPFDIEAKEKLKGCIVFSLEEGIISGGAGEGLSSLLERHIFKFGITDAQILQHGTRNELIEQAGLSPNQIAMRIIKELGAENE